MWIKYIFIVAFYFSSSIVLGQTEVDTLSIKNKLQPVSSENIFKTDNYYNWGPSIIKGDDELYHLYYSRWPKKNKFSGWLTHSEIAHAISKKPSGPWQFKEVVLKGTRNDKWDAITAHNPKIKYFEGKYYLYYIATNFGTEKINDEKLYILGTKKILNKERNILRRNMRTGVAVANSLEGPWKRQGKPIIEPSGPITTITVNPAIDQGKDGRYYLIVKGDKPNEKRFIRNQAIAIAEKPTGEFVIQDKPVIDYLDTEDMSLWYDKKRDYFYGVFHAHTYIGMVSSSDGINWEKATEDVLMAKKIPLSDGTLLLPERMERPFIYTENNEPKVLSFSVKKGDESYIVFREIE
ncbi:glycoside hydrolase family protein [Aurantibacter sp.]|uniref:glycoside hydrolase family protein n=1 Tax=Aurantibacter sp. TaxID=2807103 RepID=UPI003262E4E7